MQDFQYQSLTRLDEALGLLSERNGDCRIIAGGTDLMPALRAETIRPGIVLNVLEIDELRTIQERDDAVRIGAAVTFTEMIGSEVLRRLLPLLVQAAGCVGGPQIRNRGTIGGNIVSASPAADVLPAVVALDGQLELASKSSRRLLPISEAIDGPGTSAIRSDEILVGVVVSPLPSGTRFGFEKLGRRNAMTRARMNMSVALHLEPGGEIADIRIVPGAVLPVATRLKRVEQLLIGEKPSAVLIAEAAEVLAEEIVNVTGTRPSTQYKLPVVQNVFVRVLGHVLSQCEGGRKYAEES